jgi:hypothetical protein
MGKSKKKSKKPTIAYLPSEPFSKNFANLFENKSFSDVTFKFGNGNTLLAHKLIITNLSEYFQGLYDNGSVVDGVIVLDKDEDEKIFKALIKYFYTGCVDYTDEADLVSFIKVANKVNLKHNSSTKLKILKNSNFQQKVY